MVYAFLECALLSSRKPMALLVAIAGSFSVAEVLSFW